MLQSNKYDNKVYDYIDDFLLDFPLNIWCEF